jgi:endonuclease YncB( thermonuclease family)
MFYSSLVDWDQVTYDIAEKFVPPISYGKVVKVYDGDTITVATPLDYTRAPIYHFSVRLRGIDSPEIRGKTPEEREVATKARDALAAKVLNQMVFLQNIDTEKYGRVLADVYLEVSGSGSSETAKKQSISGWMLENHYAVAYNGGTKAAWNSSSSSHVQEQEKEKKEEQEKEESRDAFYKISTW